MRIAAVLTLTAVLAHPTPAHAESLTWSVSPSGPKAPNGRTALDYKLDPGATLTDHIAVTNHSQRPLTLRLYASDAFTTAGGGFDLLAGGATPKDTGRWIKLGRTTVTLPGSSRVIVPLTLTVPANATPGDHAGGIVASLTEGTDGQFTVDHRVGTRVYLRVTGPLRPSQTITDVRLDAHPTWNPFTLPGLTATFTIENTGNVRLKAHPAAKASGPFGLGTTTATAPPIPEILPGGAIRTSIRLDAVPPLFRDQILLSTPETQSRHTLWLIPWPQVALLAVAAALLSVWLFTRRRRRSRIAAAIAAAEQRGRDQASTPPTKGQS
ncbi:WxL protein peptidoglycan domain-containing protein [Actinoplanes sp. CA-131856]